MKANIIHVLCLGVAQLGSAPPWGGGGREFKSRHSDQFVVVFIIKIGYFFKKQLLNERLKLEC